jgi:membrane-bound inhibitor of C-type lysozyme
MTDLTRLSLRLLALACAAGSLSACATVTRGTTEAFTVETVPGGATVRTTAGYACDATPCTWKMPRKSEFTVTITKPGYKTVTTQVVHTTSGGGAAGMAGNVLIGGIVGIGVDAATGATQDIKPNPLHVVLEPDTAAVAAASPPAPTPVAAQH